MHPHEPSRYQGQRPATDGAHRPHAGRSVAFNQARAGRKVQADARANVQALIILIFVCLRELLEFKGNVGRGELIKVIDNDGHNNVAL